jgi:dienelactone hydrolase
MDTVPFTVILPKNADLHNLPIVIFQHGLPSERSDVFGFADGLAAQGFAVFASDGPFLGLRVRTGNADTVNRFTGAPGPDGFGDNRLTVTTQDWYGRSPMTVGELGNASPVYIGNAFSQTVLDLCRGLRLLQEGDWSAVRAADPALANLSFDTSHITVIGQSMGGTVVPVLASLEDDVKTLVATAPGPEWLHWVFDEPANVQSAGPTYATIYGFPFNFVAEAQYPLTYHPELALAETFADRGSSIGLTEALRNSDKDILEVMYRDDEQVHNFTQEDFAGGLGLVANGGPGRYAHLDVTSGPVSGNSADGHTRVLSVFEQGQHQSFILRVNTIDWQHPLDRPFVQLAAPVVVQNPVEAVQAQVFHFVKTALTGPAEFQP